VQLDHHRNNIIAIKDKCVKAFLSSETHSQRHSCFDQLTAMLGEGVAPCPGFDDWRKDGTIGYRPLCVKLLKTIHLMAEERLNLEEASSSTAAPTIASEPTHMDKSRWGFVWNGTDVVLRTLRRYFRYTLCM